MTVLVELPEGVEQQVREEAARAGVDTAQFIRDVVVERFAQHRGRVNRLSASESDLLRQINAGLDPERWERFHALLAARRAAALTADEHTELIALTNEIEEMNARRIGCLAQLARVRGTSLPALMDDLGLQPPPYE